MATEAWSPARALGVRRSMSSNRSTGSVAEELTLLAIADAGEGGFERNKKGLPGVPDAWFAAEKVAVFMHGCYWHRCPRCYPQPWALGGDNRSLWEAKFVRNVVRFAKQETELAAAGATVVTLWECQVLADPLGCAQLVKGVLEERRALQLKH